MHIFKAKILLYLSFNVIGYVFMFISILGTPGNPDEERPGAKFLSRLMDILLSLAWKGIPYLLLAAIIAFYLQWTLVGKLCSILGLAIGLSLFLSMVVMYAVQSGKK